MIVKKQETRGKKLFVIGKQQEKRDKRRRQTKIKSLKLCNKWVTVFLAAKHQKHLKYIFQKQDAFPGNSNDKEFKSQNVGVVKEYLRAKLLRILVFLFQSSNTFMKLDRILDSDFAPLHAI